MYLAEPELQPNKDLKPITAWLVTAKQVAEVLSVSTRTVWNLVASGDLHVVKVTDTASRFWLSDVIAYAQCRTRKTDVRLNAGKTK